jgi:hypothetical protein
MFGVWRDETGTSLSAPSSVTYTTSETSKNAILFASDLKDLSFLCGIRRANLDAFWARKPLTVKSTLTIMLRIVKVQEEGHGIPR